jgi:hypothetical protein
VIPGNCPSDTVYKLGQLRNIATRLSSLRDRSGLLLYPDAPKYLRYLDFSVDTTPVLKVRVTSKRDNTLLLEHMSYHNDPGRLQVEALLKVYHKYKIFNIQRTPAIEERDPTEFIGDECSPVALDFLRHVSILDKPLGNVYHTRVHGAPPSTPGMPLAAPIPSYIDEFYALPKNAAAKRSYDASWISTHNPVGVQMATSKLFQDDRHSHVDPDVYVSGHVGYLIDHGVPGKNILDPPDFSIHELLQIPVPQGKKSGITTFSRSLLVDAIGHTLKLVNSGDKETLRIPTCVEISYWAHLLRLKGKRKRGEMLTFTDLQECLNKMVLKPEVRQEGDDSNKVRIFFIVNIIKYIIDVNMKKATHQHRMNNGKNAIGHSWVGGGAQRLYESMGGDMTGEWEWAYADVSQKDTKFRAHDLLIHMLASWYYYKSGDNVLIELLKWSAHQTAFKNVRWLTDEDIWAFVIGVLCSGDLETGMCNTDHVGVGHTQFVDDVVKRHSGNDPRILIIAEIIKFRVQGDDIIMRTPKEFVQYFGLEAFEAWMKAKYGMTFKDKGISTTFHSDLHRVAGKILVKRPGLKFLKRRFVYCTYRGIKTLCPFRPVEDYYVRVGRTTQDQEDPARCIARCVGLLWDTMGTNPDAESFLVDAIAFCTSKLPVDPQLIERIRAFMLDDEFVGGRAYRWAVTARDLTRALDSSSGFFVNMEFIKDFFLLRDPIYDVKYRQSSNRLPTRENIDQLHAFDLS